MSKIVPKHAKLLWRKDFCENPSKIVHLCSSCFAWFAVVGILMSTKLQTGAIHFRCKKCRSKGSGLICGSSCWKEGKLASMSQISPTVCDVANFTDCVCPSSKVRCCCCRWCLSHSRSVRSRSLLAALFASTAGKHRCFDCRQSGWCPVLWPWQQDRVHPPTRVCLLACLAAFYEHNVRWPEWWQSLSRSSFRFQFQVLRTSCYTGLVRSLFRSDNLLSSLALSCSSIFLCRLSHVASSR